MTAPPGGVVRSVARACLSFRTAPCLLLLAVLGGGCGDQIHISNTAGQPVGLLIDGRNAAGPINDRTVVTTAATVGVGEITASAGTNEVAAFTSQRPVKLQATPWTSARDTFNLGFENKILIPVTVWIVKGPFAAQRDHAIAACIRTSAIWRDERMGIDFSPFEIRDATGDPEAPNHFAFPNGDVGDSVWKPLRDDIGFVAGRLNIYWVDTVNGGTGTGWSNFGAQIAMGKNTGDELLSHEIGHALSLTHVDGNANFNTENIMHSASNTRQFVTEGQLFRAHLTPTSVLNGLYGARPGQPTRTCGFGAVSDACPAIQKRIWADGGFPAN